MRYKLDGPVSFSPNWKSILYEDEGENVEKQVESKQPQHWDFDVEIFESHDAK